MIPSEYCLFGMELDMRAMEWEMLSLESFVVECVMLSLQQDEVILKWKGSTLRVFLGEHTMSSKDILSALAQLLSVMSSLLPSSPSENMLNL